MRVAVVGCGYWGSKHVRVIQSVLGSEQLVIVDPRPDRLASLTAAYPGVESHSTIAAALDQIDAAVVATSPSSHAALAMSLMSAGKHVLVEKPFALTLEDALEMRRLSQEMAVVLAVGHTFEHNSAVVALKEIIRSGDLGEVYYLDAARLNLGLYQPDCNVIWDLAPHDVSIANMLLGDTPDLVQATGYRHAQRHQEDVAYMQLTYSERNVTAQIHVSWLDPCKVRRTTVVGSEKMAVYNDLLADEQVRIFDKGVEQRDNDLDLSQRPMSYRYGGIVAPYIRADEPLLTQDVDFITSIAEGRSPQSGAASGIATVAVLEAANLSIARGGLPVSVPELGRLPVQ